MFEWWRFAALGTTLPLGCANTGNSTAESSSKQGNKAEQAAARAKQAKQHTNESAKQQFSKAERYEQEEEGLAALDQFGSGGHLCEQFSETAKFPQSNSNGHMGAGH